MNDLLGHRSREVNPKALGAEGEMEWFERQERHRWRVICVLCPNCRQVRQESSRMVGLEVANFEWAQGAKGDQLGAHRLRAFKKWIDYAD